MKQPARRFDPTNGTEAVPAFLPDAKLAEWVKKRNFVNVVDHGAIADSELSPGVGKDNSDAFDAAIEAAGEGGTVYVPKGKYRVTRSIKLNKRSLVGEFPGHVDIEASLIFADFLTGAAINVVGSRGTVIENLAVLGRNDAPIQATENFSALKSDWLSPGVDNSQNSPYCGVAIDGTDEGTSFYITIRNCSICRFAVGFAVSPFGNILGAAIDVFSCYIAFNLFNVSIGNSQNRGVRFFGGSYNHAWTSFTNLEHGTQTPLKPSLVQVFGVDSNFCYRIFDMSSSSGGAHFVSGMYSEACFSIGNFSKNNASSVLHPFTFVGCDFFLSENWANSGFLRINAGTLTAFKSCSFYAKTKIFGIKATKGLVDFQNCYFNNETPWRFGINDSGVHCVKFDKCSLDNGAPLTEIGKEIFSLLLGDANKRVDISSHCETVKDSFHSTSDRVLKIQNRDLERLDIYGINAISWSGQTVTFSCGGGERVQVGDLIRWPLASPGEQDDSCDPIPCLEVTGKSGSSVTCVSIAANVDKSATPSTALIEMDYFVTKYDIKGDTTSGSTLITNCPDAGLLQVGDFIKSSSAFADNRLRVVAVDAANDQFSVHVAANASENSVVFENHKGVRTWEDALEGFRVVAAGVHTWQNPVLGVNINVIPVPGISADDVAICTMRTRNSTEEITVSYTDVGNDGIRVVLSSMGGVGTTKINYQVVRAI